MPDDKMLLTLKLDMVEFPRYGTSYSRGPNVKRINQYDFYELGHELHSLADLRGDVALMDAFRPLTDGQKWLSKLLSGEWIELTFSRHEAEEVLKEINVIYRIYFLNEKGELDVSKNWSEGKIPEWHFSIVKTALVKFEHNFAAELRKAVAYWVDRTGIFDTEKLVEASETRIKEELRIQMNEMAQRDYKDAGRCLAFGLSTSAGFHAARAVEGVLGDYYRRFVGCKSNISDKATMNVYLKELEGLENSAVGKIPDKKTLRSLREIKDLDRNPLAHPRETLEIDEAENLFDLATAAIRAMTMEMAELKTDEPALPFKLPPPAEGSKEKRPAAE